MGIPVPIIIVRDPLRLFTRGAEFDRQEFAVTLWCACWPEGLVVRDACDNRRYEVVQYVAVKSDGTRYPHQYLLALGGDVELRATRNGNLKREVRNADTMPLVQARVPADVRAGAGRERDGHGDVSRVR